jgi:hypothetical protein
VYRIDKFLQYYYSLNKTQTQIDEGVWVNARYLPFYPGFFTKQYWKEWNQRRKDAKSVMQGKAVAVTWESDL